MEPIPLYPMLRLLAHSWEDIGFEYDGLTPDERLQLTREEFDSIVRLMAREGIVQMGLVEVTP